MPPETKDKLITYNEWEESYTLVPNMSNDEQGFWGCMSETFGEDLEQVKTYPPNQIWTLVDNNPNSVYLDIVSGFHLFNRMGYFVTEEPWEGEVTVSNDKSYYE
jgi:hypothetical protein